MKKIILSFCMMLNIVAYGMDEELLRPDVGDCSTEREPLGQDDVDDLNIGEMMRQQVALFQMVLEKMSKAAMPEIYGNILGKNFEALIESDYATGNDDDDTLEHAVGQVWDREKDQLVKDAIESMERINIYDAIPGYADLPESTRNEISRAVRAGWDQLKDGGAGKLGLMVNVKTFRKAYAVHKANRAQITQASTSSTAQAKTN